MENDNHSESQGTETHGETPQVPGDRLCEIIFRLEALNTTVHQLRSSIDTVAAGVGSIQNSLMSVNINSNVVIGSVGYLTNLLNMHGATLANLVGSANLTLNQCSLIYADTQMLRCRPPTPNPCDDSTTEHLTTAMAKFEDSSLADPSQPGETGFI